MPQYYTYDVMEEGSLDKISNVPKKGRLVLTLRNSKSKWRILIASKLINRCKTIFLAKVGS